MLQPDGLQKLMRAPSDRPPRVLRVYCFHDRLPWHRSQADAGCGRHLPAIEKVCLVLPPVPASAEGCCVFVSEPGEVSVGEGSDYGSSSLHEVVLYQGGNLVRGIWPVSTYHFRERGTN
jgi:hypothetical protein